MNTAQRFDLVASGFSDRAQAVPDDSWERPAPCEGWVARDVVRHMVDWMPGFLTTFCSIELPPGPSVDDDPPAAWEHLRQALQSILDDPVESDREVTGPMGPSTVAKVIDQFILSDVLVHTWDLARATGLDETLDSNEVQRMLDGFGSIPEEAMVASGHFGPRVPVADDADPQTRLIALTGRQP